MTMRRSAPACLGLATTASRGSPRARRHDRTAACARCARRSSGSSAALSFSGELQLVAGAELVIGHAASLAAGRSIGVPSAGTADPVVGACRIPRQPGWRFTQVATAAQSMPPAWCCRRAKCRCAQGRGLAGNHRVGPSRTQVRASGVAQEAGQQQGPPGLPGLQEILCRTTQRTRGVEPALAASVWIHGLEADAALLCASSPSAHSTSARLVSEMAMATGLPSTRLMSRFACSNAWPGRTLPRHRAHARGWSARPTSRA